MPKRKALCGKAPTAVSSKGNRIPSVDYVVGNSYRQIPRSQAKLDRSGTRPKIHDWTLFLDVYGNPDIIERVHFDLGPSFSPSTYTCTNPIRVTQPNGRTSWRFKTRQQTYAAIQANVRIRGAGGTLHHLKHTISLDTESEHRKAPIQQFVENKMLRSLKHSKLNFDQKFGIELELTSASHASEDMIANVINNRTNSSNNSTYVEVIRNYEESRGTSSHWKIVPDSSIMCNATSPNCNKFELVSPILRGGEGLGQINKILTRLSSIEPNLKVNKSMGFHLHIDVSAFSYDQLVKICQNFIKYEDVFDELMPPSRRSGSQESDRYFQSNRQSIVDQISADRDHNGVEITNRMCHDELENTNENLYQLVKLMNNNGRYYKLNMQNLATGRQTTIEFRQHSATMNYDKVSAWVRFCVAFCLNSAKFATPTPFKISRSVDFKFDALFQYIIKDRALLDYYLGRREDLARDKQRPLRLQRRGKVLVSCCTDCTSERTCVA